MHTLRIENNRLFLDDKELERVQGYALTPFASPGKSLSETDRATIELTLSVKIERSRR